LLTVIFVDSKHVAEFTTTSLRRHIVDLVTES